MKCEANIPPNPLENRVTLETVQTQEGIYASKRAAGAWRVVTLFSVSINKTTSFVVYVSGEIGYFHSDNFKNTTDWVKLDEEITIAFSRRV